MGVETDGTLGERDHQKRSVSLTSRIMVSV